MLRFEIIIYKLGSFHESKERTHKMPQSASDSNIQRDIIGLLDKVVKTGVPVEIEIKGKHLLISPIEKRRNLDCLEEHPDFIVGNPDDLVHIDWSAEWKPQL